MAVVGGGWEGEAAALELAGGVGPALVDSSGRAVREGDFLGVQGDPTDAPATTDPRSSRGFPSTPSGPFSPNVNPSFRLFPSLSKEFLRFERGKVRYKCYQCQREWSVRKRKAFEIDTIAVAFSFG